MALCKPAATELKSKNAHGLSDLSRSLCTDSFFDFSFWFIFWFRLYLDRTREILDGSWCEGRKFALTLTLTTETPINRAFQTESEGVRVKKQKKLFFISKEEHPSPHSIYNRKMNRDKPCHNSFCEPAATERRSKKLTDYHSICWFSYTLQHF